MCQSEDVQQWTVKQVVKYMVRIPQLSHCAGKFKDAEIDGKQLLQLNLERWECLMFFEVAEATKIKHL